MDWELFDVEVLERAGEDVCYVMDARAAKLRLIERNGVGEWSPADGKGFFGGDRPEFMRRIPRVEAPSEDVVQQLREELAFKERVDDGRAPDGFRLLLGIRRSLQAQIVTLERNAGWAEEDVGRWSRCKATAEENGGNVGFFEGRLLGAEREKKRVDAHWKRLQSKLARLEDGVAANILPIGTHVQFSRPFIIKDWGLDRSLVSGEIEWGKQGQQAVVVGSTDEHEWAVRLAFVPKEGDEGVVLTVADMADLEVLSVGRLLDGESCFKYEFSATHRRNEDDKAPALLVESAGRVWSIGESTDDVGVLPKGAEHVLFTAINGATTNAPKR